VAAHSKRRGDGAPAPQRANLTAAALNFLRLGEWIADVPRAKTRTSPFTLLMADSIAA